VAAIREQAAERVHNGGPTSRRIRIGTFPGLKRATRADLPINCAACETFFNSAAAALVKFDNFTTVFPPTMLTVVEKFTAT
jgi:hypothetical protein